jgi:REP element-mobilizing transposase RayT
MCRHEGGRRGILDVMLQDGFFDPRKPWSIRWGKDLPHWRQDGGTYFVTFRLSDSLPQAKLDLLRREREEWRAANAAPSESELSDFELQQRRRIEKWLDSGFGSCVLSDATARKIVTDAIRFFEGDWYELGAHAVAANHAHAIVRMSASIDLSRAIGSWKRHSSREIGRFRELRSLHRDSRHLWQPESFDHLVRDSASLEKFTAYIQNHR